MSDRFRWLTDQLIRPSDFWDVDLTPSARFATVPSKGAIVSGWLLTLPRSHTINIASLPFEQRTALLSQARTTALATECSGGRTYIFEHGAARSGTVTGCGVDYAHLHTVPVAFDLIADLPHEMGWRAVCSHDPWKGLGERDYLMIGCDDYWVVCEPRHPQSQFFRKQIAGKVTDGYGWDHKRYPWNENVQGTIDRFKLRGLV